MVYAFYAARSRYSEQRYAQRARRAVLRAAYRQRVMMFSVDGYFSAAIYALSSYIILLTTLAFDIAASRRSMSLRYSRF